MTEKLIRAKVTGSHGQTAYVQLPGYRLEPGLVKKMVPLASLIAGYKGPSVNLDFDAEGRLIGIEVLAPTPDR